MRNKRLSTLLALLLMSGGVTMQAQEREQHSWLHYGGDEYGSNLAYSLCHGRCRFPLLSSNLTMASP